MKPLQSQMHSPYGVLTRARIRADVQMRRKPPSFGERIIDLLNKPLGLWFLSAVLLGGLTEGYKSFQAAQQVELAKAEAAASKERARTESIRKLDGEISLRLNQVRDRVLAFTRGKLATIDPEEAGRIVHFADYKERSMTSLMYELQSMLSGPEQHAVRFAMSQWFILLHWEAHKGSTERNGGAFSRSGFFMPLLQGIFIDRWRRDIDAILASGNP